MQKEPGAHLTLLNKCQFLQPCTLLMMLVEIMLVATLMKMKTC